MVFWLSVHYQIYLDKLTQIRDREGLPVFFYLYLCDYTLNDLLSIINTRFN